ncbi:MAG: hypothetical protein A2340_15755, partial [Lentisphaerae bacterium RIFOXYB12_FULL_60_10]
MEAEAVKTPAHKPGAWARFRTHIRNRLISGILVLFPVGITYLVLKFLFNLASGLLKPMIEQPLEPLPDWAVALISLVALGVLLYVVGFFVGQVFGRRLVAFGERLLLKVPILKTVYGASKQTVEVFAMTDRDKFESVVLVEFPRPGVLMLGFVSGTFRDPSGNLYYRMFIPTAPNPTSGFMAIIHEQEVKPAGITLEEAIKMIVSGGLLGPETLGQQLGAFAPDKPV